MAVTDLQTSYTGAYAGSSWGMSGDGNTRNCWATYDSVKYTFHDSPVGGGYGTEVAIDDFTAAVYPEISAVDIYTREGRTGSDTGSSYRRIYVQRDGVFYSIAGNAFPTWNYYTYGCGTPAGGWTKALVDAIRLKFWWFNNGGTDEFRTDTLRVRVTWDYYDMITLTKGHTAVGQNVAQLTGSYDAQEDGDNEYRFVYKEDGGSYDSPSWNAGSGSGSQSSLTRDLTGLAAGTLHYYKLQARNENDAVFESAEGSFTTNAAVGGMIVFY